MTWPGGPMLSVLTDVVRGPAAPPLPVYDEGQVDHRGCLDVSAHADDTVVVTSQGSGTAVAIRLRDAMNAHDLEAFLACFHDDYRSEQPVHPGRGFGGREQVRANWSAIFAGMPDFSAVLVSHCQDERQEWSEWRWTGTRRVDGSALDMAGVIVMGVREGRIAWGRLYVEPVEAAGETIDQAVQRMTGQQDDEAERT